MEFEQNEYRTAADETDECSVTTSMVEHSLMAEEEPLTCDLCPHLTFSLTYELKRHKKTVHKGVNTFLCKVCGNTFAKAHLRNRHMIVHTKVKKFQCNICNKRFTQKMGLNSHNQTNHQISVSYECKVCGKVFPKKFQLRKHMKTAHFTPEVFYSCATCGKSFKYPSGLKSHLVTHREENPFPCSLCKKKCRSKRDLCEHTKKSHPETCSLNAQRY